LVLNASIYYDIYEPTPVGRNIEYFVNQQLSNWYVRLSRRRFWKGEMNDDKLAAYETLYECLWTVSQLMSPIAPFFAEWLFRNLTGGIASVHLTRLKQGDITAIDHDL